jgi:hypothetical protein
MRSDAPCDGRSGNVRVTDVKAGSCRPRASVTGDWVRGAIARIARVLPHRPTPGALGSALVPCLSRFFARPFVCGAHLVRSDAAFDGDRMLPIRIHQGESSSLFRHGMILLNSTCIPPS